MIELHEIFDGRNVFDYEAKFEDQLARAGKWGCDTYFVFFMDDDSNIIKVKLQALSGGDDLWEVTFLINDRYDSRIMSDFNNYIKIINTIIAISKEFIRHRGKGEFHLEAPKNDKTEKAEQKTKIYKYIASKFSSDFNVEIANDTVIVRTKNMKGINESEEVGALTPAEVKEFNQYVTEIYKSKIAPYNLSVRTNKYCNGAIAYRFKTLVDYASRMNDEDKDKKEKMLRGVPTKTDPNKSVWDLFEPILKMIYSEVSKKADNMRKKDEMKNLQSADGDDDFNDLVAQLQTYMRPEIEKWIEEYNERNPGSIDDSKASAHMEKEMYKVVALVYKLKSLNHQLSNFEIFQTKHERFGFEFNINCEDENGSRAIIKTQTIVAGGYNIQRRHTRWLMHVTFADGTSKTINSD